MIMFTTLTPGTQPLWRFHGWTRIRRWIEELWLCARIAIDSRQRMPNFTPCSNHSKHGNLSDAVSAAIAQETIPYIEIELYHVDRLTLISVKYPIISNHEKCLIYSVCSNMSHSIGKIKSNPNVPHNFSNDRCAYLWLSPNNYDF